MLTPEVSAMALGQFSGSTEPLRSVFSTTALYGEDTVILEGTGVFNWPRKRTFSTTPSPPESSPLSLVHLAF